MKELIKVQEKNNENLVNARDLHEFLEVKSRYNDWIKNRIEKYGFIENEDFETHTKKLVSGGYESFHILKINMAKELSMVENNDKGRVARKYFIDVEKKYKSQNPINLLLSMSKEELVNNVLKLAQIVKNKEEVIEKQEIHISHKEDVIVGLVKDIDLAEKRQRITQIIRYNANGKFQERYSLLYSEFEKKFHLDLNKRMKSKNIEFIKPKIKSKMDLIERGLFFNGLQSNMMSELYDISCKLFENDIQELLKEWKSTIN